MLLKPRANESTASKKLKNVMLAVGINYKLVVTGSLLRYPCYMKKLVGSSANGPLNTKYFGTGWNGFSDNETNAHLSSEESSLWVGWLWLPPSRGA